MSKRSSSSLRPTTPALTTRYDRVYNGSRRHRMVQPGLFTSKVESEPRYLPLQWGHYTNPEGNPYFVKETSPRFITERNLYDPKNQDEIEEWVTVVQNVLDSRNMTLPDSVEIFLEPSEDSGICLYYIVDHRTRVSSWFDEFDTEALGILPAVSETHLRFALEELYWTHVEHFPSHIPTDANLCLDELTDILIQSRIDHMTSNTSTFPYTAQECTQFLDSFKAARENGRLASPHTRWSVARLWSMIASHKFNIHYGLENCRLSRDQSILESTPVTEGCGYKICSRLLFNLPDLYTPLFDDLWVDQIVYIHRWRQFVASCQSEWKASVALSFAALFCNILLLSVSMGSSVLAFTSMIASNISIVVGVALLFRHYRVESEIAADVALYLSESRKEHSGFQRVAIFYSLPRAFLLWALAFGSMQGVVGMIYSCTWFLPFMGLLFVTFGVAFLVLTLSKRMWRFVSRSTRSRAVSAV